MGQLGAAVVRELRIQVVDLGAEAMHERGVGLEVFEQLDAAAVGLIFSAKPTVRLPSLLRARASLSA